MTCYTESQIRQKSGFCDHTKGRRRYHAALTVITWKRNKSVTKLYANA